MKIAFVVPHLSPSGGIKTIFHCANYMARQDNDVTLYKLAHDTSPFSNKIRKAKSLIKSLAPDPYHEAAWFSLHERVALRRMYPAFKVDISADAVIATNWQSSYLVNSLPICDSKKYYFIQDYEIWPIWDSIDCWAQAQSKPGDASLNMALIEPSDPYLYSYKKHVDDTYFFPLKKILTSTWEVEALARLGVPDLARQVFYGVDTAFFYPAGESKQFTISSVFRAKPRKGDYDVLAAYSELKKQHPSWRLILFGPRKTRDVPDYVEFYEDPTQECIRCIYSISDIYVMASWQEGFGMPPMEAMACSTALVSTDVGAVRDYAPCEGVRYSPIQAPNCLVDIIKRFAADDDALCAAKEANYRHIRHYTWDGFGERFLGYLQENL